MRGGGTSFPAERWIAPGPVEQELKKEGAASRDRACALLERGGTPVSIRVDDTLILVFDRKGKPLGGIRSDIELVDGGVVFSLKRYRPLQRPAAPGRAMLSAWP